MNRKKLTTAVLSVVLVMVLVPGTASAEAQVIDTFSGGLSQATLNFTTALHNSSLAIDVPRGAEVQTARLTVEGIEGIATESNELDLGNGTIGTDVWAFWNEGRGLYPPKVDPRNHQWSKANALDVQEAAKDDGNYWTVETSDNGQPPYAWPIQLLRFRPSTVGAQSVKVAWNGYSSCSMNRTANYHAELWLYNHTKTEWVKVDHYSSQQRRDVWLNYSFDLPAPFLAADGSVDVAVVGIHSEWAGPMLPAFDLGHLYTDYIVVEVTSSGGPMYPEDVKLRIEDVDVAAIPGNLTGSETIGDGEGLATKLQAIIDGHTVRPGNLTLPVNLSVSRTTAGRLLVRDLYIEYDPVVNGAPVYQGPDRVFIEEDSDWTPVMDLDAVFDDDHNRGELDFQPIIIVTTGDPPDVEIRLGTAPGGNRTAELRPAPDFFGDVPLTYYVRATDLFGLVTTGYFNITVTQVPDRPRLADPITFDALEHVPFDETIEVTDPDLPDDNFTFSDNSEHLDVNLTNGRIQWTPGPEHVGDHVFQVTVTDRFGLSDTALVTIRVNNTNDAPRITSPLTKAATQDEEVVYILQAEDNDLPFGDELTYSAFADGVDITVDPGTGRLSFVPGNGQVPAFDVTLRVQDLLGETDEAVLRVTVENVNDPPSLADLPDLDYDQGDAVEVRLVATDPDLDIVPPVGEVLTFSGTGMEALRPDEEGWIRFIANQSLVGTHQARYTVTDAGGLSDAVTVTWNISDVNDPPRFLDPAPFLQLVEDEPFSMTAEAEDPEGDLLTWSDDTDLFDVDPDTGQFQLVPLQGHVGAHAVTVTVMDGSGAAAEWAFELRVANVNDPPEIVSAGPDGQRFEEGERITFEASAVDEDGDPLTYTWYLSTDLDSAIGTGASFRYDGLPPGPRVVVLRVSDGAATAETSLAVTIREVTEDGIGDLWPVIAVIVIVAVLLAVATPLWRKRREGEG